MKSPDEITARMVRKDQGTAENACFVHSDNIVGILGESPELTQAVRDGDLATISDLCAQLFDLHAASQIRPHPTSNPS
jgi:hypothetical protein